MCFGLAPGFIVREDLDAELEDALAARDAETAETESTPAFAKDSPAAGEALTGEQARETPGDGAGPK